NDVEDDIVRVGRVRDAFHATERIELEGVANFPGNHMVCARGIAADAQPADSDPVLIERKSAAEHIHAADALAGHRISLRAEVGSVAGALLETGLADSGLAIAIAICNLGVYRITVLQAVETATRLHRREQVGSRQCQASGPDSTRCRRAAFAYAE